jgi:hypothetical protein
MLAPVIHLALCRIARAPVVVPNPPAPPAPPARLVAEARGALSRAEKLLPKKQPSQPPAKMGKLLVLRIPAPPPPAPEPPSAWDPEEDLRFEVSDPEDEELALQTINGCKTLLLEIIRRAAYDWVLYKGSRRMVQKVLADQAYRWLFLEVPGSSDWQQRMRGGKYITSFVAICEGLDLDPDTVRRHIKKLTPRNVMSVGRPAEYRRRDVFAANAGDDVYSTPGVLVEYSDSDSEDPSY